MTIPRSLTRTFHCTRGFQAQAQVGVNSPQQTNNQSVNVILSPDGSTFSPLTKDRDLKIISNKSNVEHKELDANNTPDNDTTINNSPLFDVVEEQFKERSIETAKLSLQEMESLIKNKNNLIEALSLILDIYENNPLIVNKFIVAQEEELTKLLFLLTDAEQIELIKTDPETGCTCKVDKYQHIQKIMIHKNGNTLNFKYSYPNVVQLLDNRRISWRIVI